jgi:hypothetical protein
MFAVCSHDASTRQVHITTTSSQVLLTNNNEYPTEYYVGVRDGNATGIKWFRSE